MKEQPHWAMIQGVLKIVLIFLNHIYHVYSAPQKKIDSTKGANNFFYRLRKRLLMKIPARLPTFYA